MTSNDRRKIPYHAIEVAILLAALMTTVTVSYVTVRQQGDHFRADHAYYFIRRWNDLQQYTDRLAAEQMLAEFDKSVVADPSVDVKTWLNDYPDRHAAASFYSDVNLLTELAQGYFQEKVDRELIDVLLGTVYPRYFRKAESMIVQRNKGVAPASRTWQSFLSMCYIFEPDEVTAAEIEELLGHEDVAVSVGITLTKLKRLRARYWRSRDN